MSWPCEVRRLGRGRIGSIGTRLGPHGMGSTWARRLPSVRELVARVWGGNRSHGWGRDSIAGSGGGGTRSLARSPDPGDGLTSPSPR
jgi:hypothetical protein